MKDELDKSLCTLFPKLFSTRNDPTVRTGIRFGFECGEGWYELIKECSAKIEAVNEKLSEPITAAQVKEKFGGLRFYINSCQSECSDETWKEVRDAIEVAEKKSYVTCEHCGNTGKTQAVHRWMYTLCDTCVVVEEERYKKWTGK